VHIAKLIYPEQPSPLTCLTDFHDQYFLPLAHLENAIDDLPPITNSSLWEKDLRDIRLLIPHFSKLYPLYWTNELVQPKNLTVFDNE